MPKRLRWAVPLKLGRGESKTVKVHLAWYVPSSGNHIGGDARNDRDRGPCYDPADYEGIPYYYKPWYASRFEGINDVIAYWRAHYDDLRKKSELFAEAFHASTLPPEVTEAVAANLSILKSPTVMRQHDGRLWCWEGNNDSSGSCHGTCTHVWNYAQALPHLFPDMERTLRETEFMVDQDSGDIRHSGRIFRSVPSNTDSMRHATASSEASSRLTGTGVSAGIRNGSNGSIR